MPVDAARQEDKALYAGHFRDFFKEVHGHRPFPWQEALLERALERGWPALVDVPTGLGKTAVLDVAVFLNALGSEHGRRRVFLVVDRRLIVDQAHDEAEKIRQALEAPPPGSVCERVRERLSVPGDDAPSVLDVTRMRGGVNWSWLWLERPDRYAIVTGTVDQVGSRLLFRGYGVGDQLRPIDAAMVGTDSLIVVDEAHLSDPFLSTLRDVRAMDGDGVGRPPVVVAMSASLESGDGETHRITGADESHPVAGKRLWAPKSLSPVKVTASAGTAAPAVADALAYWARQLGGPLKVIGVVTNTVSMARAVFERIRNEVDDPAGCVLLTGRVRPIDRENLLDVWYPRIKSGAPRDLEAELYVVATQTIEAGADIDLDGMITQTASLSALVQRLGRVNRLGERAGARAVVVHADKLPDPVYGSAARETWDWLTSLAAPFAHKPGRTEADVGLGLGVSPAALRELVASIPLPQQERMRRTQPYAPMVFESTLDAWVRTSPAPHPDVPVAPFLHGVGAGEPTVSVVWRAGLQGDDPQAWPCGVGLIPPSAEEAIELPISTVRRWLTRPIPGRAAGGKPPAEIGADASDLESQAPEESAAPTLPAGAPRRALRYRSSDQSETVTARQIKPGDFLVVPSDWGGCDRYGWNPDSVTPVTDVADFAGGPRLRATAIRIGRVLSDAVQALAPDLVEKIDDFISQVRTDIAGEDTDDRRYRALLQDMIDWEEPRLPHERVLTRLENDGRLSELGDGTEDGEGEQDEAMQQVAALFVSPNTSWNDDASPAGTSASQSRKPIRLAAHQAAVGRRARELAHNLDLPAPVARAVEQAALYHDEGKRDPRFQLMLHGGDQWRARAAVALLAKSGLDPANRAAFRRAARLSGYPQGMKHEALSARIVKAFLQRQADDGLDKDLVIHLVAAHHGRARPLLPAVVDEPPREVSVPVGGAQPEVFTTDDTFDWDGPVRFARLCDRYGRWGLALLESIVRLADIWCSARSEECDDHHS